jgi:hypothetical protein
VAGERDGPHYAGFAMKEWPNPTIGSGAESLELLLSCVSPAFETHKDEPGGVKVEPVYSAARSSAVPGATGREKMQEFEAGYMVGTKIPR